MHSIDYKENFWSIGISGYKLTPLKAVPCGLKKQDIDNLQCPQQVWSIDLSVCESDLKALTGYDLSHSLVLVRPAMKTSLSFNLYHSENQTT